MDEEKEILEGFNAGYILEQYRPQLTKELISGIKEGNSPFLEGFVAGSKEYAIERGKSILLGKFRNSRTFPPRTSKEKGMQDKGFEKDI